jgi:hypothetical protein
MSASDVKKRFVTGLRRVGATILAVTTAAMTVASGGVVTAFASANDSAKDMCTVSLVDTEAGSVSFKDSDKRSKSVAAGTDVNVVVHAAEGANISVVTVFDSDGNTSTQDAKDGLATVHVTKNVTIMSSGSVSVNSDALKNVDLVDDKSQSIKDYVKKHADSRYVGKASDSMGLADGLNVTTTVVDGTKLPDATLVKLNEDADGDNVADHDDALVNQTTSYVALYDVGDGDYYVGRASSDMQGAKVTDMKAAKNNANAEMVDDVIYDKATGLVYVPKSYTTDKARFALRIQLVVTTDGAAVDSVSNMRISADNDGVKGSLVNNGSAKGNLQMVETDIKLSKTSGDSASISSDMIDSVEVNGFNYKADDGAWAYDEDTGVLTIGIAPFGISDVKVNMSDTFSKGAKRMWNGVLNAFGVDAKADTWVGTIRFPSTPSVGQSFDLDSMNLYQEHGVSGYLTPMVSKSDYKTGHIEDRLASETMGWQEAYISDLHDYAKSIERSVQIGAQENNSVSFPAMNLNLVCSHVNVALPGDNGGGEKHEWIPGKAHVRVMAVDGDSLIIGVTIPTSNTQSGAGFFRAKWELTGGYLALQKQSANPSMTNGNSCYSLVGAKYGVYSDAGATNKLGELTVASEDGKTGEVFLPAGYYYVKELPGTAKGYGITSAIRQVYVTSGQHTTAALDGDMAEPPLDDPIHIAVQKAMEGFSEAGKAEGNTPDLSGIQFQIDWYPGLYDSADAAKRSGNPKASAVFATDAQGYLAFTTANPVLGSWPYKNGEGKNTFPLGSVVITEITAKTGINVAYGYSFFHVVDSGDHVNATITDKVQLGNGASSINTTENTAGGAAADAPWLGGLTIVKADNDTNVSEAQGDGSIFGVAYDVINRSKNPVRVNGKVYNVGDVVMTIKTSRNNDTKRYEATTGERVLPYGTYEVKETWAPDSYKNANFDKTFDISKDGQMISYDADTGEFVHNKNAVKRGGVAVTKFDRQLRQSKAEGDSTIEGVTFEIVNTSSNSDGGKVVVDGQTYNPGEVVKTISTEWDDDAKAYVAKTSANTLPYGRYVIREVGISTGYLYDKTSKAWSKNFAIRQDGQMVKFDSYETSVSNQVMRGGVSITKFDRQLQQSRAEGDAQLDGATFEIVNTSSNSDGGKVVVDGQTYNPGEVVKTISTEWDDDAKAYVAKTSANTLPYGTYMVREVGTSKGYLYDATSKAWTRTFSIRQDGQMAKFDSYDTSVSNQVIRGGVAITKFDRQSHQSKPEGESHLDGATFEIVNKSSNHDGGNVVVEGKTYKPGDVVKTISTVWDDEAKAYVAKTAANTLPYGTYMIHEISTSKGYLYDKASRDWTKIFQIRNDGEIIKLDTYDKSMSNQVIREDWNFKKKADDSAERMNNVAFLVTSQTTGEKHVIVTDENGTWGSSWNAHTQNTNANDPDSPITNGAIKVDADGNYYVADSSKLDAEAGTWFTGYKPEETTWAANGKSYKISGSDYDVPVDDALRAFPYDTYTVQELRSDANEGYGLVNVTVTLHKYGNADGEGLDIDYGTLDDQPITIGTELLFGADHVAPATKDIELTDTITYSGLSRDKEYDMYGELHKVSADGKDEGVVATSSEKFTPKQNSGKTKVTFTLDASGLGGSKLVAYEYVKSAGQVVAKHEDIEDDDQTVVIPKIGTTLSGDIDHEANAAKQTIKLVDTVKYEGLALGKNYILTGILMDKATGQALTDVNGNPITASTVFSPFKSSGQQNVVFTFSDVDMAGKTVVAFESLNVGDIEYATHADINDTDQTVTFPKVRTTAQTSSNIKEMFSGKDQKVVDTVTMNNLVAGNEYTLTGMLHFRNADGTDGGELKDADGKVMTVTKTFKATGKDDESQNLEFTVDASKLEDKTLVAFETLSRNKVMLGLHADITDNDQTVVIPKVRTTAQTSSNIKEMFAGKDQKVVDTVAMNNLIVGNEYTLTGTLHLKNADGTDGGELKGADGKAMTVTKTFTAGKSDESQDLEFTVDASALEGKTLVAFETLSRNNVMIGLHADITDKDQTVVVPKVCTTAKTSSNMKEMLADKNQVVIDTVTMNNLIAGNEYTLIGTLHLKNADGTDAGELKDADGNAVTVTKTFKATGKDNETQDLAFAVDASALEGKTLVAFETLSRGNVMVGLHADIKDNGQTIVIPKVRTTAQTSSKTKEVLADKDQKVVDTVKMSNLIADKKYTLTGTLHLKNPDGSDGGELKDADGKVVTVTKEFTATGKDGESQDIEFTVDASALGNQTLVAFETLSRDKVTVGLHADMTDNDQTVVVPKIGTTMTDANGSHEVSVMPKSELMPKSEYKKSDDAEAKTEDKADDKTETKSDVTTEAKADDKTESVKDDAKSTGAKVDDKAVTPEAATDKADAETASDAKSDESGDEAKETVKSSVVDGTKVTLTDTVDYDNLIVGQKYTVNGTLHVRKVDDKGNITDGGVLKDSDGKEVTASAEFTPEKTSGTTTVTFTFDAGDLSGQSVVAFEDVKNGDVTVATHADITDENQTVHFVKIGTKAVDTTTTTKTIGDSVKVSITDTVEYKNLIPGNTYTVNGALHIQKKDDKGNITDGGVLKDADGKEVTATASFVPDKANGSTEVKFEFTTKPDALDGQTLVAFEDMKRGDVLVATHADITDENQAVHGMKLGTTLTAVDGKTKEIGQNKETKLVDVVKFENLNIGETYTIKGKLVDGNGHPVKDADGKEVTTEGTFTPKKSVGTANVNFTVDTSAMTNGTKLIAYEYVYAANGTLVGKHEDATDKNQTVTMKVETPPEKPSNHVDLQTGIKAYGLLFALGLVAAAVIGGTYAYRKRHGAKV